MPEILKWKLPFLIQADSFKLNDGIVDAVDLGVPRKDLIQGVSLSLQSLTWHKESFSSFLP
ncbi:MAG: hypothetical protein IPO06_14505 [Leptospiraceae bacterium]|nr:hypothetical protein [Leptospiraceae bacterium]